jgi:hypothetical protein
MDRQGRRSGALLFVSVLFLFAGAWVLNGACAFAMLSMPPADQVPAYRAIFYQRTALGIGCIVLGIVILRIRRGTERSNNPRRSEED